MNDKLWKRFKWIGIAEAISFIFLLGIAMPLKYLANMPQAVSMVGMAHGLLFIAYIYVAYECYQAYGWPLKKLAGAFIAAFLPLVRLYFTKGWKRPADEARDKNICNFINHSSNHLSLNLNTPICPPNP